MHAHRPLAALSAGAAATALAIGLTVGLTGCAAAGGLGATALTLVAHHVRTGTIEPVVAASPTPSPAPATAAADGCAGLLAARPAHRSAIVQSAEQRSGALACGWASDRPVRAAAVRDAAGGFAAAHRTDRCAAARTATASESGCRADVLVHGVWGEASGLPTLRAARALARGIASRVPALAPTAGGWTVPVDCLALDPDGVVPAGAGFTGEHVANRRLKAGLPAEALALQRSGIAVCRWTGSAADPSITAWILPSDRRAVARPVIADALLGPAGVSGTAVHCAASGACRIDVAATGGRFRLAVAADPDGVAAVTRDGLVTAATRLATALDVRGSNLGSGR